MPQFVIDVSAGEASRWRGGERVSISDITAAWRAAATYTSSNKAIIVTALVLAVFAASIAAWLLPVVILAAIAGLVWSSARAAARRRITVSYRLEQRAAAELNGLQNGVGWLKTSRGMWQVTHEERAQRPANATSVSRADAVVASGEVPHFLSNVTIPSITAAGESLFFLPDTLVVRDRLQTYIDITYRSIKVECETMQFSETGFAPDDSRRLGESWLYANKNGTPDKRRANNRRIPILEYARVTLTWPRSGRVFLVSNVRAARMFVDAMRPITASPEVSMPLPPPTPPTDLERALQKSIDQKREALRSPVHAASHDAPANAQWIAHGGSARVHGFDTGDLVYVGSRLERLAGGGVEPSLIDPELPVDPSSVNTGGAGVPYWPSYSGLSPASRRAFLEWLAGGRSDRNAYIGYVFIFFYGLERRVYENLTGAGSGADELLAIAGEVARLIGIYASTSGSFSSYASALLDFVGSIEPRARATHAEARFGYGVSRELKLTLGELSLAGKPIPAEYALRWLRSMRAMNTPATRCAAEFELLFHIRYAKRFGDGMIVKPNKTFVDLTYRPASAGLAAVSTKQRGIPDLTVLERPLRELLEIATDCSSALDAFSRFLGKPGNERGSFAALALLPDDLIEATPSAGASALGSLVRSRLDPTGLAHLAAAELLQFVRIAKPGKVSKAESLQVAHALEKLGYGIEPDVRLGGPPYDVDGRAVIFRRLPDCPSVASEVYAAATLLVRLAAMVSGADDVVSASERDLIEHYIYNHLQLTPGERQRLAAHLSWVLEADLGFSGLKRRLELLPQDGRDAIGELLVGIAAADGQVDAREIAMLEKLYELLSIPAASLYRDIHAAVAQDDQPVPVEAQTTPAAFAIPRKPGPVATPVVNMDQVRLKIAETREVSTLLSSIFAEEEDLRPVVVREEANTIGSLDAAHSEFLRRLARRESWRRDEVEQLAAELSLLTDGALERINDYAYAAADEPVWEDEDPVTINSKVAMELTA